MNKLKSYSELIRIPTFEERLNYVSENGIIGYETFGGHRYVNQKFYRSYLWQKTIRPQIILRDNACDLAMDGYEIFGKIYIHHLNPITIDDIVNLTDVTINPEFLVCVSETTHKILHYGNQDLKQLMTQLPNERSMNDMCPWKKG